MKDYDIVDGCGLGGVYIQHYLKATSKLNHTETFTLCAAFTGLIYPCFTGRVLLITLSTSIVVVTQMF